MDFLGLALFNLILSVAGLFNSNPGAFTEQHAPAQLDSSVVTTSEELHDVLYVIDGDTFKISIDGKQESVRLIGIDTPETVDPNEPVGCFGVEARNKAVDLLGGEEVRLEQDPTQDARDKYNRILAYAFLSDGTNVNELLIEQGYGYEYTYNLPYKYQSDFKEAERYAKSNKRGLWADGVCAKPAIPAATPEAAEPSSFSCFYNAYNCDNFSSHQEAQAVFEACGGRANDVHRLDGDKDGSACEALP